MPDLILHGGAPKTGTSYLQVLFARHAEALKECGVLYPRGHLFDEASSGQITSGNGVEIANYLRPHLPHALPNKEAFAGVLDTTLREAAGNHVLYSSEFLILPEGERSSSIVSIAKKHGYRPRFVYFVRDLGAACISAYSQMVKRAGESRTFGEYINSWEPIDSSTLRLACIALGRENVEVYNYEEQRTKLAAFFFREILNVDFAPEETAVINRSLTAKELEFQRTINSVRGSEPRVATFISDALISVPVRETCAPALTQAEADLLAKRFRAQLQFVNSLIRGREVLISSDVIPERGDITLTDFERALAAVIGRLVKSVLK